MKHVPFLLFLATLLQSTDAFNCQSATTESQCTALGCIWGGTTCSGTYLPPCAPTTCYFVDPAGGLDTNNGAALTPFKTLEPAFAILFGKTGRIYIFNPVSSTEVMVLKYINGTSEITVLPIFNESYYVLNLQNFDMATLHAQNRTIYFSTTNGKVEFRRCIFNDKTAKQGVQKIFSLSAIARLTFTDCIIRNNVAENFLVYILGTSPATGQFIFTGGTVFNSSFTFQLEGGTHTITNVNFYDLRNSDPLFNGLSTFSFTNVNFNRSKTGKPIISGGTSFTFTNTQFIGITHASPLITITTASSTATFSNTNFINMNSQAPIVRGGVSYSFSICNFINITHTVDLIAASTSLAFSRVLFNNTSGPASLVSGCPSTTFSNAKFINVYNDAPLVKGGTTLTFINTYVSGGISLIAQPDPLCLVAVSNITFSSYRGNFLNATTISQMAISNSQFLDLDQESSLPFISILGNSSTTLIIQNTLFQNSKVRLSLFLVEQAAILFKNVTMNKIYQKWIHPLERSLEHTALAAQWTGGVCFLGRSAMSLSITDSTFNSIYSHCIGLYESGLTIQNGTFNNTNLNGNWEIISFSAGRHLIDYSDSLSLASSKNDTAGISFINFAEGQDTRAPFSIVSINASKFLNNKDYPKYGGAIRVTGIYTVQIVVTETSFIGLQALHGGAIYLENPTSSLSIKDCTFKQNIAINGGAIHKFAINQNIGVWTSDQSIIVKQSSFISNIALSKGGALYLDYQTMKLADSHFSKNEAINGAGIYFIRDSPALLAGEMKNNTFSSNSASNSGGAFKVLFDQEILGESTVSPNIYIKNTDAQELQFSHGKPSYFAIAVYEFLVQMEESLNMDYHSVIADPSLTRLVSRKKLSEITQSEVTQIKSGHVLDQIIAIEVYNQYGELDESINDEIVSAKISSFQTNQSKFSPYLLYSPVSLYFSKGRDFLYSNIKMIGEPLTSATISLHSEMGLTDILIDTDLEFDFDLNVAFTDCSVGDIFDHVEKICQTCLPGTYSLGDPYTSTNCIPCDQTVTTCPGGSQIAPKPGYWRYNINSDQVLKCPRAEACKGGLVDGVYNPHGECEFPYEGNLCNICADGYAKFGTSATCINCKTNIGYYLRFVAFFGIQLLAMLYAIRCNFNKISPPKKAYEDKDLHRAIDNNKFKSNLMKITVTFLQVSSIITQLEFDWPELISNILNGTNKTVPSDKEGFSTDCLIIMIMGQTHNIFFVKLVVTMLQPIILWLVLVLLYFIYLVVKRENILKNPNMKHNLMVFFIVTVFLLQPNIIQSSLETFQCQNLSTSEDPEYYMMKSSDTKCWTSFHLMWSLGIALPIFLFWTIVLPALLWFQLRKNVKHLEESDLHAKYAFVYDGLKASKYYWEFLTLTRKTLIIFFFVFLNFISVQSQAYAIFLILLIFTVVQYLHWPFVDPRLNKAEFLGLSALCVLVYCGMFFLSNGRRDWLDILLIIIAVGINLAFFSYLGYLFYQTYKLKAMMLKAKAKQMVERIRQRFQKKKSLGNTTMDVKALNHNLSGVGENSSVLQKIRSDDLSNAEFYNSVKKDINLDIKQIYPEEEELNYSEESRMALPEDEDRETPKTAKDVNNYSVMKSLSAQKSFRSTIVTPEVLNDMLNLYNMQKSSFTSGFNSNDLPYLGRGFSGFDRRVSNILPDFGMEKKASHLGQDEIQEVLSEEEKKIVTFGVDADEAANRQASKEREEFYE